MYLETDEQINKQHKTKQDHDQRGVDQIANDDTVGKKQTAEIFIKSGGEENEIAWMEQMKSCRMCIIVSVQKCISA